MAMAAARHASKLLAERRGKIRGVGIANSVGRLRDRKSLMQQGLSGEGEPAGPEKIRGAGAVHLVKLRVERATAQSRMSSQFCDSPAVPQVGSDQVTDRLQA